MRGVLTGFGVIWSVTLVGYLVGRYNLLGPHGTTVIARLVFLIATPALLFGTLARSTVADLATPALAAFVLSTVIVAAVYLLVAHFGWRRPAGETTVGAMSASYVNAANLGLPVAAYVLGDVSFVAPVLIFQVLLAAPLFLGVLDVTTTDRGLSVRRLALLPTRNPIMLGSAGGVLVSLSGWQPPAELLRPFDLVGSAAVPLALLALGMSLPGSRPLAPGPGAAQRYVAVTLKIVVQPAVAYLIARYALGLTGPALLAAVVTSALPTAQNVFVFATHYRQAQSHARDVVVLSTVVAALSLTAIAALLG
ncbi:AEC family transporter [Micromonospora sp. WMMD1102]|uniref:AEC family transporter n=1 Tax=Micromonospora sp. WMMD1102 TaxID=3016105 RepID=UPI002414D593|nr:AEC family transporter [Micromonospora sp. WMMD1102]MDG4787294.1 AEC family transporter [Micromonospora sp. WMMD1102]